MVKFFEMLLACGLVGLFLIGYAHVLEWAYSHGHLQRPSLVYYGSDDDDEGFELALVNPATSLPMIPGSFVDVEGNPFGADLSPDTSSTSSCSMFDDD
jgi:hypothetical protein